MKFTTQEGMDIMTKLTNDQKAIVEYAETHEGLTAIIEEDVKGPFTWVSVRIEHEAEWYDLKETVTVMAFHSEASRPRQSVWKLTLGIAIAETKKLKVREARHAVRSLWLYNTKAGRAVSEENNRRIDQLLAR